MEATGLIKQRIITGLIVITKRTNMVENIVIVYHMECSSQKIRILRIPCLFS